MVTELEVVQQLEQTYVPMFQQGLYGEPMTLADARVIFHGLLDEARESSREDGFAGFDANAMLALVEKYPKMREDMDWKISEGVHESDFRLWWNMHDLERHIILQVDAMLIVYPLYAACRESGFSAEEAAKKVRKTHPSYVLLKTALDGPLNDDSRLPIELKDRVNRWVERQIKADPTGAEMNKRKEQSTSMNALVREEIRKGNL